MLFIIFRSNHQKCSVEKGVLKKLASSIGKHLCRSLFLIKRLQHQCFPKKFAKFWRTTILKNICERMLLYFPYTYIYIYSYLQFLIYTYLLVPIYTYLLIIFSSYYYMNLTKLLKFGEYRNYDEISRLKSISSKVLKIIVLLL